MTDEEIAAAARKAKEFMMQVTTPKKPETPKEKPEDEELDRPADPSHTGAVRPMNQQRTGLGDR